MPTETYRQRFIELLSMFNWAPQNLARIHEVTRYVVVSANKQSSLCYTDLFTNDLQYAICTFANIDSDVYPEWYPVGIFDLSGDAPVRLDADIQYRVFGETMETFTTMLESNLQQPVGTYDHPDLVNQLLGR